MLRPIKLRIMKKFDLGTNGRKWNRFIEQERIFIDNFSSIKTEAQLCNYIKNKFGDGRYMILAWQKGYEGFWMFWLGFMMDNGFIRDLGKNKEIDNLKAQMKSPDIDYAERQMIEEEIDLTKRMEENARIKRKGPFGLIKCRPGQMHLYQEY